MRALIFACRLEADPFVARFSFRRVSAAPFDEFRRGDVSVFVSGIGPVAAALCAGFAARSGASEILNAGACGDLRRAHPVGTVLEVSKVVSSDPYCGRVFDLGRSGAVLATSSRPVSADSERALLSGAAEIVDMEAYGILSALELENFDLRKFRALKFVSDFSQDCDIEGNIKRHVACLGPHIASWID